MYAIFSPSGKLAFWLAVVWLICGYACFADPIRYSREQSLNEAAILGIGMSMIFGLGLGSLRRGPKAHGGWAIIAIVISVLFICFTISILAEPLGFLS